MIFLALQQLRGVILHITVLCLTALVSAVAHGQELRLEITGRRNPLNDNIFPVIFGKIENGTILVGDLTYNFDIPLGISSPVAISGPDSARPPSDLKTKSDRKMGAASFSVKNLDDPHCLDSKNVREIFFLINLLKGEISRISISSPRNTACLTELTSKLRLIKPLEDDSDPLKDKIRVRLHFTAETSATISNQPAKQTPNSAAQPAAPTNSEKSSPTKAGIAASPLLLTINGEEVQAGADGWFVYEPASTDPQIIAVKQGPKTLLVRSIAPTVLKAGTTERKTNFYRYIYLITNASTSVAFIAPERLDLKNIVNLSLPFFLKVSYGNTRLFPLPGEGKTDRPTILAGVKTHPLLYGMHIEADGFFSNKADSQIPWTTLVTAVTGSDFMELGNNFSIPWGIGLRAFKSKIDNSKAGSGDEAGGKGKILIPESVLGPAISLGLKFRNNYVYADASLTVTPLKLPGSDLIVTYNPSIYLGYQLTGADTVTLNYQTHDVRFPTRTKVVQVTASIVALGYVRDLQ